MSESVRVVSYPLACPPSEMVSRMNDPASPGRTWLVPTGSDHEWNVQTIDGGDCVFVHCPLEPHETDVWPFTPLAAWLLGQALLAASARVPSYPLDHQNRETK